MALRDILAVANSEFVFAVLFVLGLVCVAKYVNKALQEYKDENRAREEQLIEIYQKQLQEASNRERELIGHLGKVGEQMEQSSKTLESVQRNLQKLEDRIEDNFMNVWKELGAKADKIEINR